MDLTVAFVSDLHFGPEARFHGKLRKLTARAPELTRAFVERMNAAVRPDVVVNLGDDLEDESYGADLARYRECARILGEARARVVHVAGNHDIVHLKAQDLLDTWRLPADVARPGEDDGGDKALYYSFDHCGYHLVVLHTREKKDVEITVGARQLAWFEADLAATRLPTLVLMHHSAAEQDLRGNRWFEGRPQLCLVRERAEVRRLIREQGRVVAVFNGHLHWNHLDVIDGIPYVTVQSLIENVDDDAPGRPAAAHAVARLGLTRILIEVEGEERARYQLERSV